MLYVVHSKTDEVASTWGACLGHVKCHFTVNRTSLVSVFECFIMQICFNFVFMFTNHAFMCKCVYVIKMVKLVLLQSIIYISFISSIMIYCLKHFPLLVSPTYKLWKLSNVDIFQCKAKWFDEGCYITCMFRASHSNTTTVCKLI